MRVLMLLLAVALLVGCGEDPEPVEPDVRDDYLVQLTCDKGMPTYLMQRQSLEDMSFFVGHPLRNGEPVPEDELKLSYLGAFHYKSDGQWSECEGGNTRAQFGFNGYNGLGCTHIDPAAPVELIVWVPASIDGPESIDPALGCTPTVEAPK